MPPNRRKVKSVTSEQPADGHERSRDFLGEAEMVRLLKAAKRGRHGVRDYLLLLLMFRHGLRVSEAITLRLTDVDLDQARLWISRLKNGLSVEQPIAGDELRAIRRWLALREDTLPWLFVSERRQPLTRQAVTHNNVAPIAEEGLKQIAALYRIEAQARGMPANERLVLRQTKSVPKITAFKTWLDQARSQVSAKSPTGEALKYIAKYWDGLILFLNDGRIEMDSNAVERTIRPIALQRKNALFAGHDAGAQNWAMLASLIETCKLNQVEPHAYLTGVLSAIVNGHKQKDIDQRLPWNFKG